MRTFTIRNKQKLSAEFSEWGARWMSMFTPDGEGILDDIILGFDRLTDYQSAKEKYHGAIVGRVCGRINQGKYTQQGETVHLSQNDPLNLVNHLHGGLNGFHLKKWTGKKQVNEQGEESAVFNLESEALEEGYPGRVSVQVSYTLTQDNRLIMDCRAYSDQSTPLNITNHAFFNLQGKEQLQDVLDQQLFIGADYYLDCDEYLIPTGKLCSVKGTAIDFRVDKTIRSALESKNSPYYENKGFSIPFVLNKQVGIPDIRLSDPQSKRVLEIHTNQDSVQVYNGYYMDGSDVGKKNKAYFSSAGIALETQGYPDAVNHANFPSILLEPNIAYNHRTEYHFSTIQ